MTTALQNRIDIVVSCEPVYKEKNSIFHPFFSPQSLFAFSLRPSCIVVFVYLAPAIYVTNACVRACKQV